MMPGFEIFNACSGLSVSLNELFVELETVTGRPLARMYDSARRVDASDIAMSPALAAQRYDCYPPPVSVKACSAPGPGFGSRETHESDAHLPARRCVKTLIRPASLTLAIAAIASFVVHAQRTIRRAHVCTPVT